MFCKNCGKPIPEGAMFCAECGAKVEVETKPTQPVNKTQEFIEVKQASQAPPRPTVAQQPYSQPQNSSQGYVSAAPAVPVKKEKDSRTAVIIVLAIVAVILVAIATVMIISKNSKPKYPDMPSYSQTTEKEQTTKESTTKDTTEATTEVTTEKKYGENIGKPSVKDFDWYGGLSTQSSVPSGATRLKDSEALEGKWKAYSDYNTTGVKELNTVEIKNIQEGVVKVIVSPSEVNYDGKWQKSDGKDCEYNGSISDGLIGATSKYGTISFYDFYEKDGKQYGYGAYVNQSGETAYIALVR